MTIQILWQIQPEFSPNSAQIRPNLAQIRPKFSPKFSEIDLTEVRFADGLGEVLRSNLDVEAGEQIGDLVVGEATLAEKANFFREHADGLFAGEALLVGAGGLAELDGGAGYLVDGVGAVCGHWVLLGKFFCLEAMVDGVVGFEGPNCARRTLALRMLSEN